MKIIPSYNLERERERERQRERARDRQTDRQTERNREADLTLSTDKLKTGKALPFG